MENAPGYTLLIRHARVFYYSIKFIIIDIMQPFVHHFITFFTARRQPANSLHAFNMIVTIGLLMLALQSKCSPSAIKASQAAPVPTAPPSAKLAESSDEIVFNTLVNSGNLVSIITILLQNWD